MANRIYFANQQLAFNADAGLVADWKVAHGVQSVAVTTTFNLEQAFELGQLAIYENIEGVPDIEVTASKVLDGAPLLYHLGTRRIVAHDDAPSPSIAGRSNAKCVIGIGVWPDTVDFTDGTVASQEMECSGMFCSSLSYNFPVEDNFTEDVTFVGNNKGWRSSQDAIDCDNPGWVFSVQSGQIDGTDSPTGTGGIQRRENLAFKAATAGNLTATSYTALPTEIPGVDDNGWMNPIQNTDNAVHLQNITVSTDLGREELFELGTRQPYARVVTFPIEVTCDIEVISISGDMINAFADGCRANDDPCTGIVDNLTAQKIRLVTCEGTSLYLGTQNKLASVNYGGGDAGGGNVTVTYSYSTFNDLTVIHPEDPDVSGATWWGAKDTYLGG